MMKTPRSSYAAHNALSARAASVSAEKAQWMHILQARDAKRNTIRQARRAAPRNQSGAVAYVVSVALAVCGATAMLFGRFV